MHFENLFCQIEGRKYLHGNISRPSRPVSTLRVRGVSRCGLSSSWPTDRVLVVGRERWSPKWDVVFRNVHTYLRVRTGLRDVWGKTGFSGKVVPSRVFDDTSGGRLLHWVRSHRCPVPGYPTLKVPGQVDVTPEFPSPYPRSTRVGKPIARPPSSTSSRSCFGRFRSRAVSRRPNGSRFRPDF